MNALYYKSLIDGAWLATQLGHPEAAKDYGAKASSVRTAMNHLLWNRTLGAYDASTTSRGFVAQDANALAVYYGVAQPKQVPQILAAMKHSLWTAHGAMSVSSPDPAKWTQDISPYMNAFEVWGRFASGDTENALRLVHAMWDPMTAGDPGGTDWERLNIDGPSATPGPAWPTPGPRARPVACPLTSWACNRSTGATAPGWCNPIPAISRGFKVKRRPSTGRSPSSGGKIGAGTNSCWT